MIWYFLAEFISGVVGTLKFANWFVRRNTVYVEKVDDTAHSAGDDNGSGQSGRG